MSNYIIDISYHNGKVDLSKAKEYISGVVARCSYGWSSGNIDKQWNNNAKQANELGIPLFAYHFCYARNEYEAKREAYLALQACSKYQVCVIYYDIEYCSLCYTVGSYCLSVSGQYSSSLSKEILGL